MDNGNSLLFDIHRRRCQIVYNNNNNNNIFHCKRNTNAFPMAYIKYKYNINRI